MRRVFTFYALGIVLAYSWGAMRGIEMFAGPRGKIPDSVRQAPGGYRSFTFWRGGK